MDIFNILSGSASIISLIISLIVLNKVTKIETNIKIDDHSRNIMNSHNRISQKATGENITQAGRDANA